MLKKRLYRIGYLLADFACSYVVWLFFVMYRRAQFENKFDPLEDQQFINAAIFSVYWMLMYAIAGLYGDPYRKSRLRELIQTLKFTFFGVFVIFFAIFLDDGVYIPNFKIYNYALIYVWYFSLQFLSVVTAKILITTTIVYQIRNRKIGYATLIVGGGEEAAKIYDVINNRKRSLGYLFLGYIHPKNIPSPFFLGKLKRLAPIDQLESAIQSRKIEEVVIALEPSEKSQIGDIIECCERTNVAIKVVPETYDYLIGTVRSSNIMGIPLIEVSPNLLTVWEQFFKRCFDIGFSLFAMLCLSPIYLLISIAVRIDSRGPIFYKQERIGREGKPFFIHKFRSMYIDAEKYGPALSKENDPRITPVGRILRKLRLDELPQFWNVLVGEMAIVGPRPERQYFIEQIVKVAPHYRHLHKVRPGITSWGQVKYGYAENVSQMVERLKYDILYIENISLALDIKIILYTIIVMIEGRGK